MGAAPDDQHAFRTFLLYSWPYLCIPVAFLVDGKLRARWHLEDVSRPATGYRFKGANMQMVFTPIIKEGEMLQHQAWGEGRHQRSRWLDCTNLWPLAVVCPGVFVFMAELSSGVLSSLLVCTPFVVLAVFSLTLSQVTIFVSLLASPVVHVIYSVVNRGGGSSQVPSILWSQAFIGLTAVSLAWSVRDMIALRKMAAAAAATAATATAGIVNSNAVGATRDTDSASERKVDESGTDSLSPETCSIHAAEVLLSGLPGSSSDEERALEALAVTVRQAQLHGLTVDTPVLQTANALHAWRKVVEHQREVERDIRETDRWGLLEEKLISMNAGMPFMVGIAQVILLGASQLQHSNAFGSDPVGATFYGSLVAFAASVAASTLLLVRMLSLINRASDGLSAAARKTEAAMETFAEMRSWGILRHGDIGCFTHIAARRGMVRALEFLVSHGANPLAVDSTGQTPLDIARGATTHGACEFLEMLAPARGSGGGLASPPFIARESAGEKSPRGAGIFSKSDSGEQADGGSQNTTRRWERARNVANSAMRWVSRAERAAQKGTAKVGVEPTCAPGSRGESQSTAMVAVAGAATLSATVANTYPARNDPASTELPSTVTARFSPSSSPPWRGVRRTKTEGERHTTDYDFFPPGGIPRDVSPKRDDIEMGKLPGTAATAGDLIAGEYGRIKCSANGDIHVGDDGSHLSAGGARMKPSHHAQLGAGGDLAQGQGHAGDADVSSRYRPPRMDDTKAPGHGSGTPGENPSTAAAPDVRRGHGILDIEGGVARPLDAIAGVDTDEARQHLNTLPKGGDNCSGAVIPHPHSEETDRERSEQGNNGDNAGADGAEGEGESGLPRSVQARTAAGSVSRWVASGVRLAGVRSGKIGVEPISSAVSPDGSQASSGAARGALQALPPILHRGRGDPTTNDLSFVVSSGAFSSPRPSDTQRRGGGKDRDAAGQRGEYGTSGTFLCDHSPAMVKSSNLAEGGTGSLELLTTRDAKKWESVFRGAATGDDGVRQGLGDVSPRSETGGAELHSAAITTAAECSSVPAAGTENNASTGGRQDAPCPQSVGERLSEPGVATSALSAALEATNASLPCSSRERDLRIVAPIDKRAVTAAWGKKSPKSILRASSTISRLNLTARAHSPRSTSSRKRPGSSAAVSGPPTYSPTQSVLNITWALRRLRPMSTPRDRRAAFGALRASSPFHIPPIYFLSFVDLASLGEIPRRTGYRFLGHASKRPVTCTELAAKTADGSEDPYVVYVSHRWLEPEFKNPDNHSKARFYQVCHMVQKLAKRKGRRPCDIYLWIDYSCMNQQDPTIDRLALPYVLDGCEAMIYIEDDEYWDQALSTTEHFIFHKIRRLRHPQSGKVGNDGNVFSLSEDGEKLTKRTYSDTRSRFALNPAKGALTTETDRLYLWTLVLALEYEDTYDTQGRCSGTEEQTGFMKLLRDAVFLNNCRDPKEAAAAIAEMDKASRAEAVAAVEAEGEFAGEATAEAGGGGLSGRGGGGGVEAVDSSAAEAEAAKRSAGSKGDDDTYGGDQDGAKGEGETEGGVLRPRGRCQRVSPCKADPGIYSHDTVGLLRDSGCGLPRSEEEKKGDEEERIPGAPAADANRDSAALSSIRSIGDSSAVGLGDLPSTYLRRPSFIGAAADLGGEEKDRGTIADGRHDVELRQEGGGGVALREGERVASQGVRPPQAWQLGGTL